ncbi:hypothetical protein KEM54_002225 [Ascosphaera aggregata]|nr:hypothetical protein KEM54_002225 [Ascosphaera aggregata]
MDATPEDRTPFGTFTAHTSKLAQVSWFSRPLSEPKIDPSLSRDEDMEGGETLPTKQDDEFRPFIRRLPEFKFWHAATRAIVIAFLCSWSSIFDIPVFWPVLVVYWLLLFTLTSTSHKYPSNSDEMPANADNQCDDKFSI